MNISAEALEIYRASDVIDLHIDSFIWTRTAGYNLSKRHGPGLLGGKFFRQVDIPRLMEAHVTGGLWSITTQPFLPGEMRARTFEKNIAKLKSIFEKDDRTQFVRNADDYAKAKSQGKHAAWIGIQGGNALSANLDLIDSHGKDLLKITIVHLTNSGLGETSSPLKLSGKDEGLSSLGKDMVRKLNEQRVFVDLAHIHRRGFFDAMEVHDKSQPLISSHTGVSGVHKHWRNLDDDQIRAIADTGGVVGIMYQSSFLGPSYLNARAEWIVNHIEHVINVAGEDVPALGSDWDGGIIPPKDMPTCLELPLLVEIMLKRNWSAERIQKILGGNFLSCLKRLRPTATDSGAKS